MNEAITEGVASEVGHPPPFTEDELAGITRVKVAHGRDLDGIDQLSSLRTLRLTGCELESIDALVALPSLVTLHAEATILGGTTVLGQLAGLRRLTLRVTDVADLSPLLGLDSLLAVEAVGCPLDETSLQSVGAELHRRNVTVTFPSEKEWELTRALWGAGMRAGYYDDFGTHRLCAPGLSVTDTPESGQPAITPEELRAELAAGTTLEEMYAKYGPTYTPSSEPAVEWDPLHLRERGSADDARRWLVGGELPDELYRPLMRFVDDFPTLDYLRETAGLFTEVEERDGVELPAWLKQIRSVLAAPFHETGVAHLELPEFPGIDFHISGEFAVYEIRGPADDAERRQTVELADIYPVASGGPGGMYVLAAKLGAPDNDALYFYHSSDLSERADGVEAFGALRHYVDLFDLATAVTLQDGTRVERRRRDGSGPAVAPTDDGPLATARKAVSNAAGDTAAKPAETTAADDANVPPTDGPGMRLLAALTGVPTDELATSDGFERGVGGLATRLTSMATARLGRDEAARAEAMQAFGDLVAVFQDHGIPIPHRRPAEGGERTGWRPDPPDEPLEPAVKFQSRVHDALTDLVSKLEGLRTESDWGDVPRR